MTTVLENPMAYLVWWLAPICVWRVRSCHVSEFSNDWNVVIIYWQLSFPVSLQCWLRCYDWVLRRLTRITISTWTTAKECVTCLMCLWCSTKTENQENCILQQMTQISNNLPYNPTGKRQLIQEISGKKRFFVDKARTSLWQHERKSCAPSDSSICFGTLNALGKVRTTELWSGKPYSKLWTELVVMTRLIRSTCTTDSARLLRSWLCCVCWKSFSSVELTWHSRQNVVQLFKR